MYDKPIKEQLALLPYMTAYKQLLEGAVQLDVFSELESPVTAAALADKKGWNAANTFQLLKGLHSIGYVKREGEAFQNTPDTSRYLVRGKEDFMGDVFLFFGQNQGMELPDMVSLVKDGPKPMPQMEQAMDFAGYGDRLRNAQSGIRISEILAIIRSLPENDRIKKVLDLGCGAGCIGIGIVQDGNGRTGVLFDQPMMQGLIEETIALANMQGRISIMTGDFLRDDIGSGYDLILCSSIMLFAVMGGPAFFARLKAALNPGGVVLCVNEGIEPDGSGPWEMVLGYLACNISGMPMGVVKGQVAGLAAAGGFSDVENRTILMSTGTHDINILR